MKWYQDSHCEFFDNAYVNFTHLFNLATRGVFWVTHAKGNMTSVVRKKLLRKPLGKILRDDLILLKTAMSRSQYPELLRRVEMIVTINSKEVVTRKT